MLDLDLDEQQLQLVRSLHAYCDGRVPRMPSSQAKGPRPFPAELWAGLVDLGVIGLAHRASGAGRLDVVAAMEVLGAVAAPGPLVASHLATAALPDPLADAVADGAAVPCVGTGGWFAWARDADLVLEVDGDAVWIVEGRTEPAIDSMAREPWSRVDGRRVERLERSTQGIEAGNLALAGYLVGAATTVVALAADHARGRRQFGRTIGEFQAVAHPIARAHLRVLSARDLARVTAHRIDLRADDGAGAAAARLVAAGAALEAAVVAHQVHGALGYTEEAPLATFTRQIRQWAQAPPSPEAAQRQVVSTARAATAPPRG